MPSHSRPAVPGFRVGVVATAALLVLQLGLTACDKDRDNDEDDKAPAAAQQPAGRAFASMDWKQVDQALGRAGAMQPGNVDKIGFPRGDLHVSLNGMTVKPALALGSWVAFAQTGDSEAMVMGDLVLLESEVAPVMSALLQGGVQPTALHNHLLHESPHVLYMHIMGRGAPAKLGAAIRAALALTKTPLGTPSPAPAAAGPFGLDTAQIAQALGYHGKVNGGVYQVGVPRADTVRMDGIAVPPSMGLATAINFQPTGGGRAAVTGDFVMVAGEVGPVMQTLRATGIEVTALHSHMLGETPHLFFMHFWANDDALKLARGLRGALSTMTVRK
jgi:hypothetical protein